MKELLPMALSSWRDRPWRTALTVLIVLCSVAMMVALQGVITSVEDQFAPAVGGQEAGAAWVLMPNGDARQINGNLLADLKGMPEVEWFAPRSRVSATAQLGDDLSKVTVLLVDPDAETKADSLHLAQGELPPGDRPAVALEAGVAQRLGLVPGQVFSIYLPDGRTLELPVVGLLKRGGVIGSGVTILANRAQAAVFGASADPQTILVDVRSADTEAWVSNHSDVLSKNDAYARKPVPTSNDRGLGLNLIMLFSFIGPVIGGFLIQNTLAIAYRQRRQELALWRVIGATKQQLLRLLLLEGAALGLAGGLLGLAAGLAIVPLLLHYIQGFTSVPVGQTVDASGIGISPLLLLTSLTVGVVVTMVATLRPALAGARLSPMEARQGSFAPDEPVSNLRSWVGLIVAGVSAAAAFALAGSPVSLAAGVAEFAGLVILLPALIQWVSAVFPVITGPWGAPISLGARRMGEVRRRAAGGATTLMLSTALLLGFGAVTEAAWQATAQATKATAADVEVNGVMSPAAQTQLQGLPGVAGSTTLYSFDLGISRGGKYDGGSAWAFDPASGLPFTLKAGSPAAALKKLKSGGAVLIGSRLAESLNLGPGDSITLASLAIHPTQGRSFAVVGIVPQDWDAEPTLWLSLSDAKQYFGALRPAKAFVQIAQGASAREVVNRIHQALPNMTVHTAAERLEAARRGDSEKLGSLLALLYLVTGFAALGVIQTSLLSVMEQRRELALLRAAGATPAQCTVMVLTQVALPGVLGGSLGAASGALFGSLLVKIFALALGTELSGGLSGWYEPFVFTLGLALLATLPAALEAARQQVAVVVRQE